MLVKLDKKYFDEIYKILSDSFTRDEMRPYDKQKELFDNRIYKVYGVMDAERLKAFAAVYELDGMLFLEHLAVSEEYRNMGLGAKILSELVALGKNVCLEVELPNTDINKRRIAFYERNGFFLNDYGYIQPPLAEGQNPIELKIMTFGRALSESEFAALRDMIYEKVYRYCQ